MTGGLDARMVLSSYLSAGSKPHLYYGTGNTFVTNTYNQDRMIDKQFAEKFGLIFHDEIWATPNPIDKYWDKYLRLYGFYFEAYAGSDAIMESIKNNPCQLFTFGYCGELLRNLSWIESRKKDFFTIDEYIDDFYVTPSVIKEIVNSDEYLHYIRAKQVKICEHYHLDVNHIANEDIFYLSLERRKSADAVMLNLVNFMKYCSYSLGQYENLCAGRVTCQEADNSSFMLHCLNALYPAVLDVPVFSHCTMRPFNRETMILTPQIIPVTWKEKTKKMLKDKLPWLIFLYRKIRKANNTWRFTDDETIYRYILSQNEISDAYSMLLHREKFDDARRLVNFTMKAYALRNVK